MKISVFLHHIREAARQQGWTLPEALEWVKSLGYDLVEVDGDAEHQPEKLSRMLRGAGLGVSSVYAMFAWGKGPADLRDERLLNTAQALSAPLVMPIPGLYSPEAMADAALYARETAGFLEGMARLDAAAEKRGLTLTMEDYDNALSPIATIAGMRRFLDAVPRLTVALDTGNFLFSGEDVLEAWAAFRGRIRHVHLKDRLLARPQGLAEESGLRTPAGETLWACPVGEGVIPIREVVRRLASDGYAGALTAEFFGAADWAETIRRSAENIREMMAE